MKINSIKIWCPGLLSNNTKRMPPNSNTVSDMKPIAFFVSVSILFSFHWENGSIINSFHTLTPKSLKPSQCTSSHHWELFEDTKSTTWSFVVWEILASQTKQNKLPCFKGRLHQVIMGVRWASKLNLYFIYPWNTNAYEGLTPHFFKWIESMMNGYHSVKRPMEFA
jgi:hypothetical protein